MLRQTYAKGDWVVYCKTKCTRLPGRRARDIRAAANGDNYSYSVDKFWIVADVFPDGKLLLQTRRGKKHIVDVYDMKLRRATLWDRVRNRAHFKRIQLLDLNDVP
jgi:hypothetical protein